MAQLSDDSFAFGGALMTIEDAERLIATRISPVAERERIALAVARGRVLIDDLISPIDLPPSDNSAVDGYAVRAADLAHNAETRMPVIATVFAGDATEVAAQPGAAFRIFTGATMPVGCDTVFMQEDCRIDGDAVVLPTGLKLGANRRLQGEDVRANHTVLAAGCRLAPQHIAIAAGVGATHIDVRRKVRVALFSTGDEIADPGTPLLRGQIYDANRMLLGEMVRSLGADVSDLGILADDPDLLATKLAAAARNHDLVLTSGGVSTGDADYVRLAIEKIGKLVFWRVGIKPGRPVALAVIHDADGQHHAAFAGLPGNPVAAFVTFARIVRPMLLRLAGARAEPLIALPVRSAFAYRKKPGRREYVRVTLQRAADGTLEAVKYPQDGAGVISSMSATDGLVELSDEATSVAPGDAVGFLSYATLIG